MPKVYDCFPFFNELDILDVRLHELNHIVDHFVVCEAAYTFTGTPKRKLFLENSDRYSQYRDKIIYLSVDKFAEDLNQWSRDVFQREHLKQGLLNADENDLIIVSDVDEILRPSAVQEALKFSGVTQFSMNMYQYFINMLERDDWCCSFAVQKKYLDRLDVNNQKDSLTVSRYRMRETTQKAGLDYQVVKNSGWHFTYMGGVDKLKAKFAAYAHSTDYWPRLMQDERRLQQQIDLGIKIFSAEKLTKYVPVDETYPAYVKENLQKFADLGYIKNIYEAHSALQKMYLALKREVCFANLSNEDPIEALGNLTALHYLEFAGIEDVDLKYMNIRAPIGQLVSEGKIATQSSRSMWSKGVTLEDDASRALNGGPTGRFSFHGELELDPWWQVDLEEEVDISEIRIFNRIMPFYPGGSHVRRVDNLSISVSSDNQYYQMIYYHSSKDYIGGVDGKPFIFNPIKTVKARYVKLQLSGNEQFHLDKVYVYKKV